MKLSFNKRKAKTAYNTIVSVLVSWLIPVSLIIALGFGIQSLGTEVSPNPLQFSSIYDICLVVLWFGLPTITALLWLKLRETSFKTIASFFIYPVSLFLVSLIPLLVKNPMNLSAGSVKSAVNNTKIFFIVLYIALLIGFMLNLYLTKDYLIKSNWWILAVILPYLLTSLMTYNSQIAFSKFIHLEDFSYSNVSRMLNHTKYADVRLMNPLWYNVIALVIVSSILMIGGIVGVYIWQKTASWRQKSSPKKEEDQKNKVQAS